MLLGVSGFRSEKGMFSETVYHTDQGRSVRFHEAVACWNGVAIAKKELEAPFARKRFP
jgi:hypothetical protein